MAEQKFAQNCASVAWWPLAQGDALNRWMITPADAQIFAGQPRPHPDQVDYRFINGWVDTGDLPCREAFRAMLPDLAPVIPQAGTFSQVYFGGDNPRVDFSTFCFQPTRIARFAKAQIASPVAQTVTFEVETCGIVHVWVEGVLVKCHAPMDRNIAHKARFDVDLHEGGCEIVIRLEDLHERDTSCFFRLGLVAGHDLQAGLQAQADPEALREAARVLESLRTTRLFHQDGQVEVVSDYTPQSPVAITLHDGSSADGNSTMNVLADRLPLAAPVEFTVTTAQEVHPLFDVGDIPPGCYGLTFLAQVGDVRLTAQLGTTILADHHRIDGPDLDVRKAAARAHIAAEPGSSISRGLLLLKQNAPASDIEPIITHTLKGIDGRYDCADFWLLPLIWAWRDHAGTGLDAALWARVRSSILGFRYWLDEPGNDVMWFWSENHVLCFHVAQYLAGDTFPEEIFPNSGKTGAQHRAQAHARLSRWFESVEDHGLAEWNSSCYYPIDLLGLFTLHACSPDVALATRARQLIDKIFVMTAMHSMDGMPVGSQGRVYEKELFAGPATELGAVAAVAFGGMWCPGHERAAALFAISDYVPPAICERLHRLDGARTLEARYTQGLNENAKLVLWKTPSTQLSSVTGHRTGDRGHQQHVSEIQFGAHPLARTWVSHPGELKVWGGGRPSYWMANGIVPRVCQVGHVAALVYDLDRHDHPVKFTHVFAAAEVLDECYADGHWLYQRSGDGYCAIWSSSVLRALTTGLYAGQEWRNMDPQAGWLLVAGSAATDGDFATFRARATALAPQFDAARLRLDWAGAHTRLSADFTNGLMSDGQPVAFSPLSVIPHVGFDGAPLTALEI
ncbi:hypothetical protein ERN12_13810 [Rhodobacteraceae bacterium]|nr:hypothetical protein ERN12_13810 [Paracoccaceae bacterium]